MYLPNGNNSSAPTEATIIGAYPVAWYQNLEKYWYYRYRLVNDFMIIGANAGESLSWMSATESMSRQGCTGSP